MTDIRRKIIEGVKKGDTFTVSRTFTQDEIARFADISRDYNPVHCDERFAHARKFNTTICHGLLVASLLTEIGGQMGWLASAMNLHFSKPVYAGDTICCDFTISKIDRNGKAEAQVLFTNQNGAVVLEALLSGILPDDGQKAVMKTMLAEGDLTNKAR